MCCADRCSKRDPQSGARHAFVPLRLSCRPPGASLLGTQGEGRRPRPPRCPTRSAVDGRRAVQPAKGHGGVREVLRREARATVRRTCPGDRGHARRARQVLPGCRRQARGHLSGGRPPLGLQGGPRSGHGHGGVQGRRRRHTGIRHGRVHGALGYEDELAPVRIAILAPRQGGGWHTDQLCHALAARGHERRVLPYEGLVSRFGGTGPAFTAAGEDLTSCDAVLARIIPAGSLEQIIVRVDALHALEERGIPVINSPRAIERTVDKLWTTALLAHAGLPVPETVVCEHPDEAMATFRALGDVIVKPLFGSMGLGMVRVSDEEMAFRVFKTIETIRGVYYLQQAIDHDGRDIRAFVVGGRVLAAIERRSDGWRTNLSRGGTAQAIQLPDAWSQLAVRAAAAVGAEYAGVDLLPARDESVYVLEVNGIPGWEGLQAATGLDVAGAVIDRLVRALE